MKRSPDYLERCLALARRYRLPDSTADKFLRLLEALRDDAQAPTSVSDPAGSIDVHLADSLAGLDVDRLAVASTVADVGSGAGFPGFVLAIAMPTANFDLIESTAKKSQFIDRMVDQVGLTNATSVNDRAESWAAGAGSERYEAVTVRAVSGLPTLLEYASPLLQIGGVMVAWKGKREENEELSAAKAAERLAMELVEVVPVHPYPASRDRHLHVYEKFAPTPEGIPRRAGMAAKRPLSD